MPEEADDSGLAEHEICNRASWNSFSDEYQSLHEQQLDPSDGLRWGTYGIPEAELQVLDEIAGRDILEFGCGAAQWSIALAKLGARPVGLDLSERQLEHARRLMADAGVEFPLVHASAEAVPLPGASFDIVFCDHGAMTFADPYRTVPEAAGLLRPGGLFAFNQHSPIVSICWPLDSEHVGDRRFTVEDLIEPRPSADAASSYRNADELAWGRLQRRRFDGSTGSRRQERGRPTERTSQGSMMTCVRYASGGYCAEDQA